MDEMMKAVRLHGFGGPEVLVLEDAPRPTPAAGEILVRVRAVGINPPDLMLRDGYRALPPEWRPQASFPLILGTDVSGEVAAVGAAVSLFRPGDEVYAMVRFPAALMQGSGAYAEYVCVPATEAALKPHTLDHLHAAGAPMSLLTVWQFLIDQGHDEPNPFQAFRHRQITLAGKTVVINGAGGGVGHLAVQIAKWQGARVIAVASGRHRELLRELGADEVLDYTQTPVDATVRDADLFFDAVGGPGMERFIPLIRPGGALFLVNPLGFAGQAQAAARGVQVSSLQVRSHGGQLAEATSLFDAGILRLVIDSSYPLTDAAAAHLRAERGGLQGKLVLKV